MNYQQKQEEGKSKGKYAKEENELDWSLSVSNEKIGHHCYDSNV